MIKKIIYLLFCFVPVLISGQEYLGGIGSNPVIKSYLKDNPEAKSNKSDTLDYQPLELPFYDDFSEMTVYPDTERWLNDEAYINANFPVYPPDFGVATLDAIDADGNVYVEANTISFLADRLISKPINLDSAYFDDVYREINPGDSVYFSFYYQPQGHGDIPLSHDSLVLQFGTYNGNLVFSHYSYIWVYGYEYDSIVINGPAPPGSTIYPPVGIGCNPNIGYITDEEFSIEDSLYIPCDSVFVYETDWTSIWSAEGDTLEVFINENDAFFKYVVIPITDTVWFREDFQFRFINYASVSNIPTWKSNTDQWHIDRVKLDKERTVKDQFKRDVRFVQEAKTFLRGYSSMPYNQYSQEQLALMRDSIAAYVHNLDSVLHELGYNYYVQNDIGDTLFGFEIDDYINYSVPYKFININDYQPFSKRPVKYFFTNTQTNSNTNFRISHVAWDADSLEIRDTIIFNQTFSNYMSRDDGSVERGYGIAPAGAKCAIKFEAFDVDTLWGVQIYINKTINNANNKFFNITVWNDFNGEPGDTIYQEKNQKPKYMNGLNRFGEYWFTQPKRLSDNVFYIGWEQPTNFYLNVGFDENNNSRTKNFFNTGSGWVNSSFEGSIMIRPIFGKTPYVGVTKKYSKDFRIKVYPNPVKTGHDVKIDLDDSYKNSADLRQVVLEVFDIYGKRVYAGSYSQRLSTIDFKNGFYLLRITDKSNANQFTTKLIISR